MGMPSGDCIFCRIVGGEAPAAVVYEDDGVLAFVDIRSLEEGHTLVIPKRHYAYLHEIPDGEVVQPFLAVKRVARAVMEALGAEGVSIVQNNGHAAGQEILHVHVHVIPRYRGPKASHPREGLEAVAWRIKRGLAREAVGKKSAHDTEEQTSVLSSEPEGVG